LINQGYIHLSK